MTMFKTTARFSIPAFSLLALLALSICSVPVHAKEKKKKTTDDRELALELSKTLGVAAAEGQRFAKVRDTLARARLRSTQRLEESLVDLQESRSLRLHSWEVVGETYRLRLLDGVLTATEDMVRQRDEERQRRAQLEQTLAQTRSAVDFKSGQLLSAARSLAALAEPPTRSDASALFNQLLQQTTGSPDVRTAILNRATKLAQDSGFRGLEQATAAAKK